MEKQVDSSAIKYEHLIVESEVKNNMYSKIIPRPSAAYKWSLLFVLQWTEEVIQFLYRVFQHRTYSDNADRKELHAFSISAVGGASFVNASQYLTSTIQLPSMVFEFTLQTDVTLRHETSLVCHNLNWP